ncbi:hypothetical protein [Vermiculatibacterium agrestimuris]|uniref:hypothetical protein n=1 Tax=Vermiculatibacterium agrestimuris TaxID=2941519 RepID=UPI00203D0E0E|nr:hypothetical protein [Vermiculatibacterium agrestimuris]
MTALRDKTELWLLCEQKHLLSWTQNYICLLTHDALYMCKKSRKIKLRWENRQAILSLDRKTFMEDPRLRVYRREDVEEYSFFVSYNEREPDITPIDEAEKYATISFRDKASGKKITLRCACEIQEMERAANRIFAE